MQLKLITVHGGINPVLNRFTCMKAGLIPRIDLVNALEEEFQDLFPGIECMKNFEYIVDFAEECT